MSKIREKEEKNYLWRAIKERKNCEKRGRKRKKIQEKYSYSALVHLSEHFITTRKILKCICFMHNSLERIPLSFAWQRIQQESFLFVYLFGLLSKSKILLRKICRFDCVKLQSVLGKQLNVINNFAQKFFIYSNGQWGKICVSNTPFNVQHVCYFAIEFFNWQEVKWEWDILYFYLLFFMFTSISRDQVFKVKSYLISGLLIRAKRRKIKCLFLVLSPYNFHGD